MDVSHHGGNRCVEIAIAVEFGDTSTTCLHCDHQRQRLAARVFIERQRLFNAVVGHLEIVSFEGEDDFPACSAHQRRHQHNVGLDAQLGLRRRGNCWCLRPRASSTRQQQSNRQPHPHTPLVLSLAVRTSAPRKWLDAPCPSHMGQGKA